MKAVFSAIRTAAAVCAVLVIAPGVAGAEDDTAIIEKAVRSFESITAMTAKFTQTPVVKGFGAAVEPMKGVVTLQKPLRMRWEYTEPPGMLLVADGERIWNYDPEEKTVYFDTLTGFLHPKSPALFLAGDEPLADLFNIGLAPTGKNDKIDKLTLKLVPREPQPGVKGLLLEMDGDKLEITGMTVVDHLGNRNVFRFSDVNRSVAPDPSLFRFEPPTGVAVRSMRGLAGNR